MEGVGTVFLPSGSVGGGGEGEVSAGPRFGAPGPSEPQIAGERKVCVGRVKEGDLVGTHPTSTPN